VAAAQVSAGRAGVGAFATNVETWRARHARAFAIGGSVVTTERFKLDTVKVPNICEHFKFRASTLRVSWRRKAGSSELDSLRVIAAAEGPARMKAGQCLSQPVP
jgi:hypothetical protein